MTLKEALVVARGTDLSIHKMGYACSVEDMRHRALDALLIAYENIKLVAASGGVTGGGILDMLEEMETK